MISAQKVKDIALAIGFSHCGIARAEKLELPKRRFEESLNHGLHAEMNYLEREVEKRFDPSMLLPGCQSVIVTAYNYYMDVKPVSDKYRVARFAWIDDYHIVVKELLEKVVAHLRSLEPCQCRITVDSSCISEKNWAAAAGVGCFGKNGMIHNEDGSFFVLGTILTDVAVDSYDFFRKSDCGNCRICMDMCPAHALTTPYRVDAAKCFAYHTIENKNVDSKILASAPMIFGCDICQEVCPKNKKKSHNPLNESKRSVFLQFQNEDFENLTVECFKTYFGKSAIARRKYERFFHAVVERNNATIK